MRLTPHVSVAAAILLLALVFTGRGLLTSGGHAPISQRDLRVPRSALPAAADHPEAARSPLVTTYAGRIAQNPFAEPELTATAVQSIRLPPPPPPPLALPEIPILPLSTR